MKLLGEGKSEKGYTYNEGRARILYPRGSILGGNAHQFWVAIVQGLIVR
jgi:hypothetical protein